MKPVLLSALVLVGVGCAHTNNHSDPPMYYVPPVTTPILTEAPKPRNIVEYPCGHEMEVHVGEGDVNLPKLDFNLGSQSLAVPTALPNGNGKVATQGYVLHIKDATFYTRTYCQHEE